MLVNTVSAIALVVFGIFVPVFVFFLPALVELLRPKDSGPRIIEESGVFVLFRRNEIVRILKIDGDKKFDSFIVGSLARIIEVLPNLEA